MQGTHGGQMNLAQRTPGTPLLLLITATKHSGQHCNHMAFALLREGAQALCGGALLRFITARIRKRVIRISMERVFNYLLFSNIFDYHHFIFLYQKII